MTRALPSAAADWGSGVDGAFARRKRGLHVEEDVKNHIKLIQGGS
jgi:hypothetical protein